MRKNLKFVPLREHPEFREETAHLLNSQWSRSLSARLHSLSGGSASIPCSLILLKTGHANPTQVIGHSRLVQVLGKENAVLVECVIIEKKFRRCGLGRWLMELTETYASQLGYTAVYLSTTDKCQFYEHLGYQYCTSVSPVRAIVGHLSSSEVGLLQGHFGQSTNQEEQRQVAFSSEDGCEECVSILDEQRTAIVKMTTPESSRFYCGEQPQCSKRDSDNTETMLHLNNSVSKSQSPPAIKSSSSQTPPPPPPPPPQSNSLRSFWMMKELL